MSMVFMELTPLPGVGADRGPRRPRTGPGCRARGKVCRRQERARSAGRWSSRPVSWLSGCRPPARPTRRPARGTARRSPAELAPERGVLQGRQLPRRVEPPHLMWVLGGTGVDRLDAVDLLLTQQPHDLVDHTERPKRLSRPEVDDELGAVVLLLCQPTQSVLEDRQVWRDVDRERGRPQKRHFSAILPRDLGDLLVVGRDDHSVQLAGRQRRADAVGDQRQPPERLEVLAWEFASSRREPGLFRPPVRYFEPASYDRAPA